jgi:hypothetical protein
MTRAALLVLAVPILACGGAAREWVESAAAANAQADVLLRDGKLAAASKLLDGFVSGPVPGGVAGPDRRAVLADAYARLAVLAVQAHEPARALRYADAGLALGEQADVFTSALYTARGRAQEALGHDVEAAREYEAAQRITEALLEQALGGGDR